MRFRAGFLAMLALLLLPMSVAAAGKPVREPLEFPPEGIFLPAGTACEFDLLAEFPVSRQYATTFFDAEGNPTRTQFNGALFVRLTNLEDDVSMVFNISGPSRLTYNADGTQTYVFLGRGIAVFEGIFHMVIGRTVFLLDETGLNVIEEGATSGRTVDICSMLAAD